LGLLPTLLANMQEKSEELTCEQMTLQAAMRDQMSLFSRHGFAVENGPLAFSPCRKKAIYCTHCTPMIYRQFWLVQST
jgi:hypothetical protein